MLASQLFFSSDLPFVNDIFHESTKKLRGRNSVFLFTEPRSATGAAASTEAA